jgi:hypothetical protein
MLTTLENMAVKRLPDGRDTTPEPVRAGTK